MSFKVKGKIVDILPLQTGNSSRGEWKKADFVVETTEDQFPKKICFTLFNDKTDLVSATDKNKEVEVSFNLEGREFNGKWYHNVNAFRVDKIARSSEASTGDFPPPPPYNENDFRDVGEASHDDLPF
ncbi:MAG: DUF3127 domain-containing protein [Marinilabiliales bacterium]|nr:DUF3127 domain-containing protein [Marinilabiliales bacterium]